MSISPTLLRALPLAAALAVSVAPAFAQGGSKAKTKAAAEAESQEAMQAYARRFRDISPDKLHVEANYEAVNAAGAAKHFKRADGSSFYVLLDGAIIRNFDAQHRPIGEVAVGFALNGPNPTVVFATDKLFDDDAGIEYVANTGNEMAWRNHWKIVDDDGVQLIGGDGVARMESTSEGQKLVVERTNKDGTVTTTVYGSGTAKAELATRQDDDRTTPVIFTTDGSKRRPDMVLKKTLPKGTHYVHIYDSRGLRVTTQDIEGGGPVAFGVGHLIGGKYTYEVSGIKGEFELPAIEGDPAY